MDFMNDDLREAMLSGKYICSKCGELMEFEDEFEDILVCSNCGHSVDLDRYGFDDEEYEQLYLTREEVLGYDEEELEDDGETYDEVYGELSDD